MRRIKMELEKDIMSDGQPIVITKYESGIKYLGVLEWKELGDLSSMDRGEEGKNLTLFLKAGEYEHFNRQLIESLQFARIIKKDPNIERLEGTLGATKDHLSDMRKLAFGGQSE